MSPSSNEYRARRRGLGQETAQTLLTDACQNKIMGREAGSDYTLSSVTPSYLKRYHRCDQANIWTQGKSKKILCELESNGIDGDEDYSIRL